MVKNKSLFNDKRFLVLLLIVLILGIGSFVYKDTQKEITGYFDKNYGPSNSFRDWIVIQWGGECKTDGCVVAGGIDGGTWSCNGGSAEMCQNGLCLAGGCAGGLPCSVGTPSGPCCDEDCAPGPY